MLRNGRPTLSSPSATTRTATTWAATTGACGAWWPTGAGCRPEIRSSRSQARFSLHHHRPPPNHPHRELIRTQGHLQQVARGGSLSRNRSARGLLLEIREERAKRAVPEAATTDTCSGRHQSFRTVARRQCADLRSVRFDSEPNRSRSEPTTATRGHLWAWWRRLEGRRGRRWLPARSCRRGLRIGGAINNRAPRRRRRRRRQPTADSRQPTADKTAPRGR